MSERVWLRPPVRCEAGALTELCLRSKAYWGYDAAFMEACRAELSVSEGDITSGHMIVAATGDVPAGVAQVVPEGESCDLGLFFVDPAWIGHGVGRQLWDWSLGHVRAMGAMHMTIAADPGAEGFYRRMGAETVGTVPSGSIPGRRLPHMVFHLG